MSGAVSRRILLCTDMASGPWTLASEHRHADHDRVEDVTEREKDDDAEDDDDGVVDPAGWRRRGVEIAAPLGGDARIDTPAEERTEQEDRTEIAVRQEMREGPGLHRGQHRMLGLRLDVARDEIGDEQDHGNQHEADGDVPHESPRGPGMD